MKVNEFGRVKNKRRVTSILKLAFEHVDKFHTTHCGKKQEKKKQGGIKKNENTEDMVIFSTLPSSALETVYKFSVFTHLQ